MINKKILKKVKELKELIEKEGYFLYSEPLIDIKQRSWGTTLEHPGYTDVDLIVTINFRQENNFT